MLWLRIGGDVLLLPLNAFRVRTGTNLLLIKIQPDATVCRYLFTAKLLYMFRVSQHPSSGVLKTVTAASSTGHNTGAATSLQRGLIGTVASGWIFINIKLRCTQP